MDGWNYNNKQTTKQPVLVVVNIVCVVAIKKTAEIKNKWKVKTDYHHQQQQHNHTALDLKNKLLAWLKSHRVTFTLYQGDCWCF